MKRILIPIIAALAVPLPAHAVRFTGQTGVSGISYATEESMERRIDFDLRLKSDSNLDDIPLKKWEFELKTFFEGSVNGDSSLDTGDFGYRWKTSEKSHVWFGRFNPAREAHEGGKRFRPITPRDAIGNHWVQQRANALNPRNQGWLSLGWQKKLPGSLSLTLAGSYLFVPTLGPTSRLSPDDGPSGTRFATLPPQYADINNDGSLVPLHYQVDVDLAKVLFQPQFYAALNSRTKNLEFQAMAWTAPRPGSPDVETTTQLRVSDDSSFVLVGVDPTFRREAFLGGRLRAPRAFMKPELQTAFEVDSKTFTVSAAINPIRRVKLGVMHSFENKPPADPGAPTLESANYADRLVWAQAELAIKKFRFGFRMERHFTPGKLGMWIRPSITFLPSRRFSLYARADVLTGDDVSYYGAWRALDSFGAGARIRW